METPAFHFSPAQLRSAEQPRKRGVKGASEAAPTAGGRGFPRPSLLHCKFLVRHCYQTLCSFLWLDQYVVAHRDMLFVVCHCHTAASVCMVTTAVRVYVCIGRLSPQ